MKVYLSYPMSGQSDHGVGQATRIAKHFREDLGLDVVVPHEIMHGGDTHYNDSYSHADYVRQDILLGLDKCDAIALCEGWPYSSGCRAEFNDAAVRGKRVFFVKRVSCGWDLLPMDGR